MQISVQIGLNWNWPTGTELGKIGERRKKKDKKGKMGKNCQKKNWKPMVIRVR